MSPTAAPRALTSREPRLALALLLLLPLLLAVGVLRRTSPSGDVRPEADQPRAASSHVR
ncbi:MAG: hypothetical protein ACXW61_16795 [Gemmatirosa sp.]